MFRRFGWSDFDFQKTLLGFRIRENNEVQYRVLYVCARVCVYNIVIKSFVVGVYGKTQK